MIQSLTHLVKDPQERKIVDHVLKDFEENVISSLHKLERGTSLFVYNFKISTLFLSEIYTFLIFLNSCLLPMVIKLFF